MTAVEPTSRRRGRPRASESPATDDDILRAALHSFATVGYDGTSVRELNAKLGVSHNLIHRRFGTKADLWKATADRWFGEFAAELEPVLDGIEPGEPLEAFRAYLVTFIEVSAARPELLRMMAVEAAIESERIEYVWQRHMRPFGQRVDRVARSLTGAERYTALPPTTVFFLLAHGAIAAPAHEPIARRIDTQDPRRPDVLRRHADAVADLLLGVDPSIRLATDAS
jgi:TetR/AcrR family transcriptional regulator